MRIRLTQITAVVFAMGLGLVTHAQAARFTTANGRLVVQDQDVFLLPQADLARHRNWTNLGIHLQLIARRSSILSTHCIYVEATK